MFDNGCYPYGYKREIQSLCLISALNLTLYIVEDDTNEYTTMVVKITRLQVRISLSLMVQAPA